jgi:hypothetical protein
MGEVRELEFAFDIASPYAYLASKQIEGVALRTGATLLWTPVLLEDLYNLNGRGFLFVCLFFLPRSPPFNFNSFKKIEAIRLFAEDCFCCEEHKCLRVCHHSFSLKRNSLLFFSARKWNYRAPSFVDNTIGELHSVFVVSVSLSAGAEGVGASC